jgi:hypothetical protein
MTIAWTTVEDGIQDWVVAATGLAGDKVIWSKQNSPRPAAPYVEVALDVKRTGQDWIDTDDAAAPSAENELDYFSRGNRIATIRLNCFGGPPRGPSSAGALLNNVISKHRLPTNHQILINAGVGVSSFGDVLDISGVLNTSKIESRASLTVMGFLSSEVSETGTYVSDVEVTDQISVPDNVFTVEGGV